MPFQSMIHRAGIVAAVLVIASCALIANSLWRDRTEAIAEAQRNNVTMSVIVSKQLERSVRMIDNLTYDIAAMLPAGSLTSLESLRRNLNSPGVQAFLESRLQRHMLASVITIIDREGKYVVTTRSWPTPGIDVSQGEFFAQMRDQADSSLAVSKTTGSRATGHCISPGVLSMRMAISLATFPLECCRISSMKFSMVCRSCPVSSFG